MLKQRVLSALVLLPLFIGMLWLPNRYFSLCLGAVLLLALWEWFCLMDHLFQRRAFNRVVFAISVLCLTVFLVLLNFHGQPGWYGFMAIFWLLVFYGIQRYPGAAAGWKHAFILWPAGVLVLSTCGGALMVLQAQPHGPQWVLYFLMLIWVADSAAYFTGRIWGRKKLAAAVSPGKSWEGVYGALVFTVPVSLAGMAYFQLQPWYAVVLIGLGTVMVSIIGDLFESMLKREAGIKDSSRLIPGHGGVLDRIDSVIAAAPLFVFSMWLLGRV